ncbi:kinase-like domain-containing protein [Pisolithus croceorrhizus]|nr:kinase-like domain-containing protein [Pisolithus croceorrhizus]KAI6109015.1 kinase-like domain-containing protein [Pisolithus croceorrhizus]
MSSSLEERSESPRSSPSSSSTTLSFDEEQINSRLKPDWSKYRNVFECNGYHLETARDVKDYYLDNDRRSTSPAYRRACALQDEDALCEDPGLPDNLFRATRHKDGKKLVIKAVNLLSRELDVARYISSPALRRDPMNHCIPIFDFLDVPTDGICFVVMEEWSSCLLSRLPATMHEFLSAIHQCIEHIVFLHRYHIVHLDISIYNFVTDYRGHYACIDYELSRRLDIDGPQVFSLRGTEIPPELERGEASDPYMVDIWALAMLILRACQATGYGIPELLQIARSMLNECPGKRPCASAVLRAFRRLLRSMGWTTNPVDGILELAANNYLVTQSI